MTTPFTPRRYGNDSGDRILANLRHAAERDFWPADVVEDNGEYDD